MFDTANSTSVYRLLYTPESKSALVEDDRVFDEIREESRLETFQDQEFLQMVRSELFELPESDSEREAIETIPLMPSRNKFVVWFLKTFTNWKFFHHTDINIEFDDIDVADTKSTTEAFKGTIGKQAEEAQDEEYFEEVLESLEEEHRDIFSFAGRDAVRDFIARMKKQFVASDYTIGLDIGTDSVKYILVKREKGKNIIERHQRIQCDYPDSDEQGDRKLVVLKTLEKIIPYDILPFSDVHVSISGQKFFTKTEVLPKMDRKELEEAVKFKSTGGLPPGYSEPETIYQIVDAFSENESPQITVRMTVYDKTEVEQWIETLSGYGIYPGKIYLQNDILARMIDVHYTSEAQNGTIIIDFGGISSQMVFMEKGRVNFVRNIDFGVDDYLTALTGAFKVGDETVDVNRKTAEIMLRDYGLPDPRTQAVSDLGIPLSNVNMLFFPVTDKLITELKRNIGVYSSRYPESRLKTIIITGGGSHIINLDSILESQLDLPVIKFNCIRNFTAGRDIPNIDQFVRDSYLYTNAIGLATDFSGEYNLLPDTLKNSKRNNLALAGIAASLLVMVTVLIIFSINISNRYSEFEGVFRTTESELQSLVPEFQEMRDLMARKTEMENLNSFIEQNFSGGAEYVDTGTVLKILSEIEYSGIMINSIQIEDASAIYEQEEDPADIRRILLTCESQSDELEQNMIGFVLYLRNMPYFNNVEFKRFEEADGFSETRFTVSMFLNPVREL